MENKRVLIIGGGVTGLSAALDLAGGNVDVDIVEKSDFPGGHGIQLSCKATDRCVKCGACVVEEKLRLATAHPRINVMAGCKVSGIQKDGRFVYQSQRKAAYIDPRKCTNCGRCMDICPVDGAIGCGYSAHHAPFFAIRETACLYMKDRSCSKCRETCPEDAITLDEEPETGSGEVDAVVIATGFQPFAPVDKPYGYRMFSDVVTNLELERMLRREGQVIRPSTGEAPRNMAFIQCVGSRDAKLKHLWCSKVCCASALRMALKIRWRQPDTQISVFYIDIQTCGRDFESFYRKAEKELRFVRSIPGDIVQDENRNLQVSFFNNEEHRSDEEAFDLVVLSIGMMPFQNSEFLSRILPFPLSETGFALPGDGNTGIYTAGAVQGPMSIAESVASAGETAWQVFTYLKGTDEASGSE